MGSSTYDANRRNAHLVYPFRARKHYICMRGRILIVDDKPNTAGLLAECLHQHGYAVGAVNSGGRASNSFHVRRRTSS